MLWGPEDWDQWALRGSPREVSPTRARDAVVETLSRLPGRSRMTVADLGCGRGSMLRFLASEFEKVVAVDYAPASLAFARRDSTGLGIVFRRRDLRDLTPFRRTFHVAVALDSILGPRAEDVNRILEQVHGSLVEGGLFLGTFPAAPRRGGPVPLSLGRDSEASPAPIRFTEMDLQYRLRRSGFTGAKLRRFPDGSGRDDVLLCIAVRRANN